MRLLKPYEAEGRISEPSAKDKKRILDEMCRDQDMICYLCERRMNRVFEHPRMATIEHVVPGKAGRNQKDWRRSNLRAACLFCNSEKGSQRLLAHRAIEKEREK